MSDNVTVTLIRDRMYRARQEDRTAITVKGGVPTEVPRWVAEAWGVQAEVAVGPEKEQAPPVETQPAHREPWPGYDDANVPTILERLEDLSATDRARVGAYETRNKARSTVLKELARWP